MTYAATVLADSPVVYYRCGDSSGNTAADSSGNSRDGTYYGTGGSDFTLGVTGLLTGDSDKAVALTPSGAGPPISAPSGSWFNFGTGDFTLELWYKGTASGTVVLCGENHTNSVWMGIVSGKLAFSVNGDSTLTGSTTVNDGATHYLVACRRSGNTYLYVDGAQDATQSSTGSAAGATNTFAFGAFTDGAFYTAGTFDECAVYGTGLTGARVSAHYAAGTSGGASFTIAPTHIPKNHSGNITLTLTGSGTSWSNSTTVFTPSGVTGVTKISQNVSSSTAATVVVTTDSTHTGTLTITESVTGSATATTTVATATLAISPTSGNTGTTPTLTLTGGNTVWTQETAAGLFSVSGGTGDSIATPTITTDTAGTAVLTVGSAGGTLTVTDNSTGATATFTANASPVTLLVNDANWFFSPYNWFVSGSSYALAVNPGAYFKINFNGTSAKLDIDVSAMVSASVPSGQYPRLRWAIDDGQWQNHQLAAADTQVALGTGLANSQHALLVYLLSSDAYTARWDGTMSLKVTGLDVDNSTTSSAPTLLSKRLIGFGDSTTEGAWNLGDSGTASNYSLYEDATGSYLVNVAQAFAAEVGNCSFGGQAWDTTWNSDVPAFPSAWDFYFSTNSRLSGGLFSPAPDYLLVNMGQNGGVASSTTVKTWLGSVRTAAGSACKIFLLIPFSQTGVTNLTTGFNAYVAANPSDTNVFLLDLGSSIPGLTYYQYATFDGIHPNLQGDALLGATVAQAMQAQLTGGGGSGGAILARAFLGMGVGS